MLTQLSTVKDRLGLNLFEAKEDTMLINAIRAVSARFDRECCRTLARTIDATEEFDAADLEIRLACYPVEGISRFELKPSEHDGWAALDSPEYLVRQQCVVSLRAPLGGCGERGRITYTGGYLLPGTSAVPGSLALPDDLEQAAVEQVAFWYQNREKVGVARQWPKGGTYEQFEDIDLLPSVRSVLRRYQRWLA